MDDTEAAPPQIGSYVTPLIISAAGIVCCTLAIVVYHFIVVRLCLRAQRTQDGTNGMPRGQKTSGVDEEILDKIPILTYSTCKGEIFRLDQSECAICLGELEDGELVRLLPACRHAFHVPCIDGWFLAHSNCPICRSSITSEPESPTALENESHERVSHVQSDDQLVGDLSASNLRLQGPPIGLLRHSVSLVTQREKKPQPLVMELKRSFSLDQSSYIAITIQREQEKASLEKASTSAAAAAGAKGARISKARSLRQLDHVSSMLVRSFSQFRRCRSARSGAAVLPM